MNISTEKTATVLCVVTQNTFFQINNLSLTYFSRELGREESLSCTQVLLHGLGAMTRSGCPLVINSILSLKEREECDVVLLRIMVCLACSRCY